MHIAFAGQEDLGYLLAEDLHLPHGVLEQKERIAGYGRAWLDGHMRGSA
jgi:hypothetical protein